MLLSYYPLLLYLISPADYANLHANAKAPLCFHLAWLKHRLPPQMSPCESLFRSSCSTFAICSLIPLMCGDNTIKILQIHEGNTINIAKLSRGGRNIPLGTYRISNRCEAGTTGACASARLNKRQGGCRPWHKNLRNLREI